VPGPLPALTGRERSHPTMDHRSAGHNCGVVTSWPGMVGAGGAAGLGRHRMKISAAVLARKTPLVIRAQFSAAWTRSARYRAWLSSR